MDIAAQELKEKLDNGQRFLLIDVREPWENDEYNIGGQLMPLGDLMGRLGEIEDHKTEEVVVYCRSGNRSGMAKSLLQSAGFTNVRNLLGGMLKWKEIYG